MKKKVVKSLTGETLTKSDNAFPVVGIGASAGGLDAFKKLITAIPKASGMAYVLVQHLDPTHESVLPELLQKITSIPVLEITDDIKVEPDHIYIIPSNKILIANNGVLKLTRRPEPNQKHRNMPIDLFFTSLAEVHQSHSIGVVLSGSGSDGTKGLKAIKDQGGITIAQDEASAAFNSMPQSAVQAGVVDFILPPDKIPFTLHEVTRITNGNSIETADESGQSNDNIFNQILSVIRIRKGTDFTYYKQTTIRRRILRRMAMHRHEDPATYLKYLRENKEEQDVLYQDFLIPVTEFFRDNKSFEHLCDTVFPQIIKNKGSGESLRIWIAGCSTGQEAYSVAICLKEFLGTGGRKVQIFATDISEQAIVKARSGIYKKSDLDNISPQRLKDYFIPNKGGYQVSKEVREMCIFATHNFLKDPPFGKVDLISCRNVLIYMEPYLQKKALTTFHYALNLKGFLLLGKTESIGSVPDLFASAVKGIKLFTRKDAPGKFMYVTSQRSEKSMQNNNPDDQTEPGITDFHKAADDVIRRKYTPAGVVVNEVFDIVNYRGKTTDYLEQLEGKPSHNLLKLARQELAFELRTLLHKAKKENSAVTKENIFLHESTDPELQEGKSRLVRIEVIPLNTLEPHFLILFHEIPVLNQKPIKRSAGAGQDSKDLRIKHLEHQLLQTHEDMRSITEDQEAVNEELQSSNEELLSSSEELQSLNEELETSKEELQSTNEELMVVNQEMIGLMEQITEARDYAEAIVSTVHSALLVLDKHFRVKSANELFYKMFAETKEKTEGEILFDLGNRQWNIPPLRKFLQEVVLNNKEIHSFEVSHDFPDIGKKVMQLNASRIIQKNKDEDLILVSIKDDTDEATIRKQIEESEKRLHNLIYSSPSGIGFLRGKDMIVTTANEPILQIWGKGKEVIGKKYFEAMPELITQGYRDIFTRVYKTGEPYNAVEIPWRVKQKGELVLKYYNYTIYAQYNVNNKIEGVGIIANEVTAEALINRNIKESEERFRTLTHTLPQLIWVTDSKGNLEFASSRWKEYSGVEPSGEDEWKEIVHPEDYRTMQSAWHQCLAEAKVYITDVRIKNKEGYYRWHTVKAEPVLNSDNEIVKWVGAFTDIDNQKAKEQEKDEFISIASHEMKTPLTTAKAYLQMLGLSLENADNDTRIFAVKASQAVDRLNELIGELLDVSKMQLGKLNYTMSTFDFNDFINDTVENLQLTWPQNVITKTGKVKSKITGDSNRLQQVVINLLTNAMKYSPDSKEVFIDIAQNKDVIKVAVRDTGIGMSENSISKIFNKYHRIEEHTAQFQGMGIGLYISYEIIQRHQGKLWVESEVGKGSTFFFTLPVKGVQEIQK